MQSHLFYQHFSCTSKSVEISGDFHEEGMFKRFFSSRTIKSGHLRDNPGKSNYFHPHNLFFFSNICDYGPLKSEYYIQ